MPRFGGPPVQKKCRENVVMRRAKTHYSTLGVPPCSSAEELRRKFLELAEIYHPDKAPRKQRDDHDKYCQTETHTYCPICQLRDKFTEITFAYAIVKDEKARARYDKELRLNKTQCMTCHGEGKLAQGGFRKDARKKICPMCEGTGQAMMEVK